MCFFGIHCLSLLGLSSNLRFYVQVLLSLHLLHSDITGEVLVIVLMLSFFLWTNIFLFIFQEGETIRINVKNKPSSGTGMLSAAGLLSGHPGTVKAKTLSIAPPPSGGVRIQSPLRPPPNDSAAARMTLGRHNTTLKGPKEVGRHSADPLADLSQLEVPILLSVMFLEFHLSFHAI